MLFDNMIFLIILLYIMNNLPNEVIKDIFEFCYVKCQDYSDN